MLGENLRDFGRLWERICETLGAHLQEFGRHWEGIHENLGDFGEDL